MNGVYNSATSLNTRKIPNWINFCAYSFSFRFLMKISLFLRAHFFPSHLSSPIIGFMILLFDVFLDFPKDTSCIRVGKESITFSYYWQLFFSFYFSVMKFFHKFGVSSLKDMDYSIKNLKHETRLSAILIHELKRWYFCPNFQTFLSYSISNRGKFSLYIGVYLKHLVVIILLSFLLHKKK